MNSVQSRDAFRSAAEAFVELAERIPPEHWSTRGLGDWDLRALVGHAGRALTTLADYLGDGKLEVAQIGTAAAYVSAAARARSPELNEQIRLRGVEAGMALGVNPAATLRVWLARAEAALATARDDIVVPTPFGLMSLADYLPTRTLELVVHGIDVADALGVPSTVPDAALRQSLAVLTEAAVGGHVGVPVIRALTGRAALVKGFSVVP